DRGRRGRAERDRDRDRGGRPVRNLTAPPAPGAGRTRRPRVLLPAVLGLAQRTRPEAARSGRRRARWLSPSGGRSEPPRRGRAARYEAVGPSRVQGGTPP